MVIKYHMRLPLWLSLLQNRAQPANIYTSVSYLRSVYVHSTYLRPRFVMYKPARSLKLCKVYIVISIEGWWRLLLALLGILASTALRSGPAAAHQCHRKILPQAQPISHCHIAIDRFITNIDYTIVSLFHFVIFCIYILQILFAIQV